MKNYKPSPLVAGLSLALLRGISVVFMGIFGNFRPAYESFVNFMGGFYIGYSISFLGILIGLLRAIVDAFCSGFILIRIYNLIYKRIKK